MGEEFEREAYSLGLYLVITPLPRLCSRKLDVQRLAEEDLNMVHGFALKVQDHLSDRTFEKFPLAFPSVSLPTPRQTRHRLENLAGFKTVEYDCCPNSCICYSGPHTILNKCPYCDHQRRNEKGAPFQTFKYTPIIPRLRTAHASRTRAQAMRYRAHEHWRIPGLMTDIFDGEHYRELLKTRVCVDGQYLSHCFFSDTRDIVLGLSKF